MFKKNNPEYIGNMWGWKFSIFGLVLLLFMLALMAGRACYLEKNPEQKVEMNEHNKTK